MVLPNRLGLRLLARARRLGMDNFLRARIVRALPRKALLKVALPAAGNSRSSLFWFCRTPNGLRSSGIIKC